MHIAIPHVEPSIQPLLTNIRQAMSAVIRSIDPQINALATGLTTYLDKNKADATMSGVFRILDEAKTLPGNSEATNTWLQESRLAIYAALKAYLSKKTARGDTPLIHAVYTGALAQPELQRMLDAYRCLEQPDQISVLRLQESMRHRNALYYALMKPNNLAQELLDTIQDWPEDEQLILLEESRPFQAALETANPVNTSLLLNYLMRRHRPMIKEDDLVEALRIAQRLGHTKNAEKIQDTLTTLKAHMLLTPHAPASSSGEVLLAPVAPSAFFSSSSTDPAPTAFARNPKDKRSFICETGPSTPNMN